MNICKEVIHLMGTKISLYVKADKAEILVREACNRLSYYNQIFSANSPDSQLARLKKSAAKSPQKVDSDLYDLIKIGINHSLEADSFLNIAIGPLIKLWRIGFADARLPDSKEIQSTLALLDPKNIHLNDKDRTIFFSREGTEIDLGAIAKGYFSDQIMAYFIANGAISAMIDIGGNVLVHGPSPKNMPYWQIGIQNPFLERGHLVASIQVHNQSVVTSGIYERTYERDGKNYHHIFDTNTGYPLKNNLASLTIVADRSIDCDLYTTKLFGLDAKTILSKVNAMENMGAIVITLDGQMAYSENLKDRITLA